GGEFGAIGNTMGTGGLASVACPELRGGAMNASFTADAKANATLRAFVQASGDLAEVAAKVEADVYEACRRMGGDLGVPADQMQPHGDQNKVGAACGAVSARMDAILHAGAQ